jgi:hypothetical protein
LEEFVDVAGVETGGTSLVLLLFGTDSLALCIILEPLEASIKRVDRHNTKFINNKVSVF